MKYNNTNFMQLTRSITNVESYWNMSDKALRLFIMLNELEQRYTGVAEDFFFRSNEDLARDCNFSLSSLKRAKTELLSLEPPLIQSWQIHFIDNNTGKMSDKHISAYRILK